VFWGFKIINSVHEFGLSSPNSLEFWSSFVGTNNEINYLEVLFATPISIALAFILSGFETHNELFKWGKKFNATHKFGDNSVLIHTLNQPDVQFIFVRDNNAGLIYYGKVFQYNQVGDKFELLLQDVDVYKAYESIATESDETKGDATSLYQTDFVYLLLTDNFVVEYQNQRQ
jgi:hypothetical protein